MCVSELEKKRIEQTMKWLDLQMKPGMCVIERDPARMAQHVILKLQIELKKKQTIIDKFVRRAETRMENGKV